MKLIEIPVLVIKIDYILSWLLTMYIMVIHMIHNDIQYIKDTVYYEADSLSGFTIISFAETSNIFLYIQIIKKLNKLQHHLLYKNTDKKILYEKYSAKLYNEMNQTNKICKNFN